MTYAELADCIGVDKGVVSRIVNGHREWKASFLLKAAECLDCAPYQLLTTDPRIDPPIEDLVQRVPANERERLRRLIEAFAQNGKPGRNKKPK